jgi:hypothetical protein
VLEDQIPSRARRLYWNCLHIYHTSDVPTFFCWQTILETSKLTTARIWKWTRPRFFHQASVLVGGCAEIHPIQKEAGEYDVVRNCWPLHRPSDCRNPPRVDSFYISRVRLTVDLRRIGVAMKIHPTCRIAAIVILQEIGSPQCNGDFPQTQSNFKVSSAIAEEGGNLMACLQMC